MKADIIVDLQYGDCGKGKVTHSLLKSGNYTKCMRYNGSGNAGHTIYHNGEKLITHYVPAGVFFNVMSIIGPGCAVHPGTLREEIEYLESNGIDCINLFVDKRTHVITNSYLEEDGKDTAIGTTKRGNGPAFRNKYGRSGLRAENCDELRSLVTDVFDVVTNSQKEEFVLMEGAQGFGLDPDWGDYPYVTSSHCTVPAALQNGIPWSAVHKVYGVAKGYETYVGAKKFQPEGDVFNAIADIGHEYGATTGRRRQVNWLDINLLKQAVLINGVTDLVVNKMDVLQKVGQWAYRDGDRLITCQNEEDFQEKISEAVGNNVTICWSYSPEYI